MDPSSALPASCGPHDGNAVDGTAPAPSEAATDNRLAPVYRSLASRGSFRRRDRWGKLDRESSCSVCGRCLWVNYTRARPCLFCDESASEAKR